MSWNAGYVTDLGYTYGYYTELNPLRAQTAVLGTAIAPPKVRHACELGFGQGLSLLIHAAAQPDVQWWGTDFNPSQAAFARDAAASAGVKAHIFDQSFAEFADRDDLPEFDFISLHGIWSWINDDDRRVVVEFVRRRLAVGGILYISYNALPGWSVAAPLRHLIKQGADTLGVPGQGIAKRIDVALEFADRLMATQPLYARSNPQVLDRLMAIKGHGREYLAHEYMNRSWQPMYFSEMVDWLDAAKLSHVGPVTFLEQQDAVNMTPEQATFLAEIPDHNFRESVRDYVVGQQFRRDLWMKGARRLHSLDHLEALRAQRYVMVLPRNQAPEKAKGLQAEVNLSPQVYNPLFDFLSDHKIRTFRDIEQIAYANTLNLPQVISAIGIMIGVGAIAPVQDDKTIAKARTATQPLNLECMKRARGGGEIGFLASPVTGGGIAVPRFEQLFLLARQQKRETPRQGAEFIAEILTAQGQQLIKNGVELTTPEENFTELLAQAELFAENRLPVLKALGIA